MTKEEKEKRSALLAQAKEDYISGSQSLAALARKWALPASFLSTHCAKEGWCELRRARSTEPCAGGDNVSADKLRTLMGLSDTLDTLLLHAGEDMESRGAPIKEIKELTGTLKDAIAIKRELWSIPKNDGDTQLTVRMAVPEEYLS